MNQTISNHPSSIFLDTLPLFRQWAILHVPWFMLVLVFVATVTSPSSKYVVNLYRLGLCLPILLMIKKDDFVFLMSQRFSQCYVALLTYTGITLFWGNDIAVHNYVIKLACMFLLYYALFLIWYYRPDRFNKITSLYQISALLFTGNILLKLNNFHISAFDAALPPSIHHHVLAGWYFAVTALLSLYQIIYKKHTKTNLLFFTLFTVMTFLSQSRSAMTVLFLGIFVLSFYAIKKEQSILLLKIILVSVCLFIIIYTLWPDFFHSLIARGDAGRSTIYADGLSVISRSPYSLLLGHGANASIIDFTIHVKTIHYHNLLLSTLFYTGMLGTVILLSCLAYSIIPSLLSFKHNVWSIVLIAILMGTITDFDQFYTYPKSVMLCFIIPMILSHFNNLTRHKEKQKLHH